MEAWESQWIDYYEELGVSPKATPRVLKAARNAMAKDFHPDINLADAERMTRINLAYEILSDPERRSRYHRAYEARNRAASSRPPGPSAQQWEAASKEAHRKREQEARAAHRKQASQSETQHKTASGDHARTRIPTEPISPPPHLLSFLQPLLVWGAVLAVFLFWLSDENGNDIEGEEAVLRKRPATATVRPSNPFVTWTTDPPRWSPMNTSTPSRSSPTEEPRSRKRTAAALATSTAQAEAQYDAVLARAYERMEKAAQRNNWSLAVQEAERLLSKQPGYRDANEKRLIYLDQLWIVAVTAYNEKRWDEAVELLLQLRSSQPSNADVRRMIAYAGWEIRNR